MAIKTSIFAAAVIAASLSSATPTVVERATPTFRACPKASNFHIYVSQNGSLTDGHFGTAFAGDVDDSFYVVYSKTQTTLQGSMLFNINQTNGHLTSMLNHKGKKEKYLSYTVIDQEWSATSPLFFSPRQNVNGNLTESETPIPKCDTTSGTLQCSSLGGSHFALCGGQDQALHLAYKPNANGCYPVVVTPVCKA